MCGRVIQSSGPLRYTIVDGMNIRDSRVHNYPPRWNGAPSQDLLVIRRNHQTGEISLDPLRWGLVPYWCNDPKGGRKPINAKYETVRDLPTFRDAYRKRRCILPVDGFFEWKAIKGQRTKQPYAIAMKDGAPFGIAGIWENWKEPASGQWIRTFAIITGYVGGQNVAIEFRRAEHRYDRRPAFAAEVLAVDRGWSPLKPPIALTPGLIAAIALALLHDGFGLRSAIGRQRATDLGLPGRELSSFAADIALVALVRLDQLTWHGQISFGFPLQHQFWSEGSRGACLDCQRGACPSFHGGGSS
jgi:putative SOS response-associated peptidase YedK